MLVCFPSNSVEYMIHWIFLPGFVWEREFDPVHVSLRALYKKDIQTALDRYTEQ